MKSRLKVEVPSVFRRQRCLQTHQSRGTQARTHTSLLFKSTVMSKWLLAVIPQAFPSTMCTVNFLPTRQCMQILCTEIEVAALNQYSPFIYVHLAGGNPGRLDLQQECASCKIWRHTVCFGCHFLWMFSYRKQELPGIPLLSHINAPALYTRTYFSV